MIFLNPQRFTGWQRRGPGREGGVGPPSSLRAGWLGVIVVLMGLFAVANLAKGIYVEWLWFENLGFNSVYTTLLGTKVALFVGAALVFLVVYLVNVVVALRLVPATDEIVIQGERVVNVRRWINLGVMALGIVLSLIFGGVAVAQWDNVLRFLNAQPFGVFDPLFGQDVSFYVFGLPAYRFVQQWALSALTLILLVVAGIYFVNLGMSRAGFLGKAGVRAHLSLLAAVLAAVYAWKYWRDMYELVFSSRGVVFGASYADVNAELLALKLLIVISAAMVVILVANVFLRGIRLPLFALAAWIVVAVVMGNVYPTIVQRFQVQPNELAKEKPYIENNIAMTRHAFGIDDMEELDFAAKEMVSAEAIKTNPDTINNIRLWDHKPLKTTLNQIQAIRLYYDFNDVDIDRYTLEGKYRQVMLSARELSPNKLAAQAQTWVNQRLQFTHGYGAVMVPVNEFKPEGLPILFIQDIPPVGIVNIERPEIYHGELTNNYVIVNTGVAEFDYPKGDTNEYTRYQGSGGVLLNSIFRRFLFAWEMGDPNIILTPQLTDASRILYYRNIQQRVNRIAPFLTLDSDPYLVIEGGRLVWVQDAYTVTNNYPYSQPVQGGFNYIRNSVKVVIDAYEGSVRFYIADPNDPIVKTYAAIFPKLFLPLKDMTASLRQHLRYPEGLFRIQSEVYRNYHMTDPQVFYNKEDEYNITQEASTGTQKPMDAYYVILRLPNEPKEEFLLMLPFTPAGGKNNTIAWLAGRSDGENYGKLLAFKLPKDRLVYGPLQIEARIDQDPVISAQLTLWSQRGSQVIRGNLLMIPLENSFLYVEAIYLQAEQSKLPELKRVIVASGNRIAMEPTLQASLAAVFGAKAVEGAVVGVTPPGGQPPPPTGVDVTALARAAQDHYNKAQERLKAGDWAGYGAELSAMAQNLQRIIELAGAPLPGGQ